MSGYGSTTDTYGSLTLTYGDTGGAEEEVPPGPQPTPRPPGTEWDLTGTSDDPAIPAPTGPYRFTPPADDPIGPISLYPPTVRANPQGTRLMAHFTQTPVMKTIYKLLDGTYTEDQPVPAIVNHSAVAPGEVIIHRYWAGTTETVSAAEKADLEAAGYTVDTV